MHMMYKAFQDRVGDDQNLDIHNKFTSSPTKTILGALTPRSVSRDPIIPKKNMTHIQTYKTSIPEHIEEIPFRRQDKRILYARKKRVVDRKLIILLNAIGLFILIMGLVFFVLYFVFNRENKRTRIFVVLGPVLAVIGIVVMMFSIEVCMRLWRNKKREKDPEIDDVENIHHIKHWIHPELIPFGWGHRDSLWESSINDAEDIQIDLTQEGPSTNQESNLVKVLAHTDISSDIFDESLRYNGIDRPTLSINPSSPIEQICGEFQDPQEKVKNIFMKQT